MSNKKIEDIRNIAIIAHVDHGKTTLIDSMLKDSGIFRENEAVKDRVMDSDDIERERGITIFSKNASINYKDTKINIIDTPGHADFGGEVERVLKMVDGVILLVDAFEGPMPQTRFVLSKAFDLDLKVIIAINKIDRAEARPEEVIDEVLDLFIDMGADEKYLDSPFIYASGRDGWASDDYNVKKEDMSDMFDTILDHIPCPEGDEDAPLQLLISTIDYNEYIGRIGIGRITSGKIRIGQECEIINYNDKDKNKKVHITKIHEFKGVDRVEIEEGKVGDIIAVAGVEGISIGDTICDLDNPKALPFVKISEPTISMTFSVNNSPFAGQDGKYLTSRQIKARLMKELQTDVSLKVEETDSTDSFKVSGRGELHLSVLIENMRRELYEFQVSKPEVLYKEIDGKLYEPMETAVIDVSEEFIGVVIEKLGARKGELKSMSESNGGYTRLEFSIPSRGLIGYRQEFMTDTKGEGILNSNFQGYERYKGDIGKREEGSIISFEEGVATSYGLHSAENRGILFIGPGTPVYEGMLIGSNLKGLDIDVNVCRKKKQTNVRASGSDDALKLSPAKEMSLEEMLEFIEDDELVEVTPKNLRMRKKILKSGKRYKSKNK